MTDPVFPPAPGFRLSSVAGGPVALGDLYSPGSALLVFASEECPTCGLTLRRLAPLVEPLSHLGIASAVIFEDPLEVAARAVRRAGFPGAVLSEPPPYDVSRSYELVSLPTTVLVDRDGKLARRVVGWDAARLDELLERACAMVGAPAVRVTDEPPRRKPGCAAKSTLDEETLLLIDEPGSDDLEEMFERGWTDGLPVIPPTPERVEAMLGGRNPRHSLGELPPAMGRATLERVAACAVLAGCRPDYFPVVVAAVQAALEPRFNVGGQAVTTQPAGQVMIVNGPIRDAIGLNGSMGALGPGWRANMTIGRALRLVISLTGGGFPGRLDRSTLGQPGKLGLCLAEDEAVSPWEPLHVERGYAAERLGGHPGRRRRPVVDLRSPEHDAEGARARPRLVRGRNLESRTGGRWAVSRCSSSAPSMPRCSAPPAGASSDCARRSSRPSPGPPPSCVGGRPRRRSPPPTTSSRSPSGRAPRTYVFVVAGGEAGRYSAVFGPCLGMDSQIVSKEIR